MNASYIYIDCMGKKNVPSLDIGLILAGVFESVLKAQNDFVERILKKKERLNISSVPAHDDECNCTESD
jgi:hypothetical protein